MYAQLDIFGFPLRGLTDDEHSKREASLSSVESQIPRWKNVNPAHLVLKKRRLRDLTRRGIPQHERAEAWMHLCGAYDYRMEFPDGYYEGLLSKGRDAKIDIEITRKFKPAIGSKGIKSLKKIVSAFSLHSGTDADARMMAITGFILSVIGHDREADAFWLQMALVERVLYSGSEYKFGFWCRVQEETLRELLRMKNPDLGDYIEEFLSLEKISETWYRSLFVLAFPPETVARIWDCLMFEGPIILHQVAMATLLKNQNMIIMSSTVNLPRILEYRVRRVFDSTEFMKSCFISLRPIRQSTVERIGWAADRRLSGETEFQNDRDGRGPFFGFKQTIISMLGCIGIMEIENTIKN